jgi:two-component system chemotaxis sensor kinase CheA
MAPWRPARRTRCPTSRINATEPSPITVAPDAPDEDIWPLIFEAGFSTAEEVTDVSGRGVGMDVVKRNIQSLNGTIDLSSTPGEGMRVTVSVPLTLAIMEAMTVSVGGEIYVLPLACVVESRTRKVSPCPGRVWISAASP